MTATIYILIRDFTVNYISIQTQHLGETIYEQNWDYDRKLGLEGLGRTIGQPGQMVHIIHRDKGAF